MLFSDVEKIYSGDVEVDRMYIGKNLYYDRELLNPLFHANFLQPTNWKLDLNAGRATKGGQIVQAAITKPMVVSGGYATSWGKSANIAWEDTFFPELAQEGSVRFRFIPDYNGVPDSNGVLFVLSSDDPISDIIIANTTQGYLTATVFGVTVSFPIIMQKDEVYDVRLDFAGDRGTGNNFVKLYINGIVVANDLTFPDSERIELATTFVQHFMRCGGGTLGKGGKLYILNEIT